MTSPRPRGLAAATTAGLAGFGCMAAELTAVRLQAPWFGDSAYVWTNVIGVILASLAGGAVLGGYLANREQARAWLVRVCVGSGLLLALAPFLTPTIGSWLLPTDLPLDAAMPAMVRGSLVATGMLFAVPMLLLGAIGPLLVTLLVRGGKPVGSAAGMVSAAGTLGSLAGTFAATHWLVPMLGCRLAMTIAGALLVIAGILAAVGVARAVAGGGLLLVAGLTMLHGGPLRPAGPERELLAERETPYQLLQVVRERLPDAPDRTLLLINEGLDSFHSVAVEGSQLTGAYYDWHAVAPLLAADGTRPADLRALSIGDAAGSLRAVYAGVYPGAMVDGVDIDPMTMTLGDRFFAPAKAAGDRVALDGRVFANLARKTWHVIHVDAYARQVYVPAHLASREFFARLLPLLEDGGVVACNVGGLSPEDPVLRAIGTTLADVFGHALALHVPRSRNFLLVARKNALPDPAALATAAATGHGLTPADAEVWRYVLGVASDPARWHAVGEGGVLLDDDRPVLDELMTESYVASPVGDTEVVGTGSGSAEPEGAELRAYEAYLRGDWLSVLAACESSSRWTAYLGTLAGDACWSLRRLGRAHAEYRAALDATEDAAAAQALRDKLANLAVDLAMHRRAAGIAHRNAWFAWVLGLLALGAALLLYRMSRMPAAPSVSVLVAAR